MSTLSDVSGTEEDGGKDETPKNGMAWTYLFWAYG